MCEDDEWPGDAEFLLVEGVGDVDDVDDDQHDEEDHEVETDEEGGVVDHEHVVYLQDIGHHVDDAVQCGSSVPYRDDGEVEGELHHLQIVDACLIDDRSVGGLIGLL